MGRPVSKKKIQGQILTYAEHGGLDEVSSGDDTLLALGEHDQPEQHRPKRHRDAQERLQLNGHRFAKTLFEGQGDLQRLRFLSR